MSPIAARPCSPARWIVRMRNLVLREPRLLRQIGRDPRSGRRGLAGALAPRRDAGRPALSPGCADHRQGQVPSTSSPRTSWSSIPPRPPSCSISRCAPICSLSCEATVTDQWVRERHQPTPAVWPRRSASWTASTSLSGRRRLWLAQMRIYAEMLARHPGSAEPRCRGTLFASPVRRSSPRPSAISAWISPRRLECSARLFATYSKSPGHAFDNDARLSAARRSRAGARPGDRPRPALAGARLARDPGQSRAPARRRRPALLLA